MRQHVFLLASRLVMHLQNWEEAAGNTEHKSNLSILYSPPL